MVQVCTNKRPACQTTAGLDNSEPQRRMPASLCITLKVEVREMQLEKHPLHAAHNRIGDRPGGGPSGDGSRPR